MIKEYKIYVNVRFIVNANSEEEATEQACNHLNASKFENWNIEEVEEQ